MTAKDRGKKLDVHKQHQITRIKPSFNHLNTLLLDFNKEYKDIFLLKYTKIIDEI